MEHFKCRHCGAFFDEEAIKTASEYKGECHGVPSYENISSVICPECGRVEDYEEAERCVVCGELYVYNETDCNICSNCMMNHSNIDFCYKIGKDCETEIEINGFLTSIFSKEQIEEILFRELKKADEMLKINCVPFIEEDSSWFAEKVIKEVKENENIKV